ncbi:GSCOCG00008037001-RA-CDS [Cotesia congregata]|nr:GSCOCG00008037001-RA-CDS [Cotesia congregata]
MSPSSPNRGSNQIHGTQLGHRSVSGTTINPPTSVVVSSTSSSMRPPPPPPPPRARPSAEGKGHHEEPTSSIPDLGEIFWRI